MEERLKRDELRKSMSFWDYFFVAFGIYAGVGWVTTIQAWLQHGPAAGILGFAVCGLFLIPVGLVYVEMTLAMPVTGGSMAFAYKAFGRIPGMMTGWFLALGYIITCPLEAASVSIILNYLFPILNVMPLYDVLGFTIYLPTLIIGVLFTIFFTVLNYIGVEPAKIFQTVVGLVTGIIVFSLVILVVFKGEFGNLTPAFAPGESEFVSFFAVLALAPFFLAGFEAIPQMAEESKNEKEAGKIGNAIVMAIILGIVFYCATTFACAMAAPWQITIEAYLPTAFAFESILGPVVKYVVLIACLFGLLSTWNGCLMAGARVLFSMGRGRLIPKMFGEAHPKFGTPYKTVVFIGIITVAAPFLGKAVLVPVVDVGAFSYILAWFMVCLSAIKLRKTEPNLHRPFKMPLGSGMAVIGLIVCIGIGLLMLIPGTSASLSWPEEWLTLIIWTALGILCVYRVTKGKTGHITVDERNYLLFGDKVKYD